MLNIQFGPDGFGKLIASKTNSTLIPEYALTINTDQNIDLISNSIVLILKPTS